MGWGSGSIIAGDVWNLLGKYVPEDEAEDVAAAFVTIFEDHDCDTMEECRELYKMARPTCFVSGHLDLTQEEFDGHYAWKIEKCAGRGSHFVVGDAPGADAMAQKLLDRLGVPKWRIEVYHIKTEPRNLFCEAHLVGGFESDEERDACMTDNSDRDIAWVRLGRESSGTAKNLERRECAGD